MPLYKQLFHRFHEVPDYIPASHYRWYVFGNYAFFLGGAVHFLFIFLFALVGVKQLALFNIASSIMWAFAFYFNFKGYSKLGLTLGNIEIVLHAWLCTLILGWNTGFHYYILVLPLIFFLAPWPVADKIIASFVNLILYGLLNHFYQTFTPLIAIDPMLMIVFKYTNIATFVFISSYFGFYYRAIVIEVETKLETEHQKTNQALIERNEILTKLNEELVEAADYVKSMLPKQIKEGPVKADWRFFPSTSLGGDAFGYHWIDEDHFSVYLLDVSGHGVGAALLSVSVLNALRSQTLPRTDFKNSKQVLESLNIAFPGDENNDMFFTIWYGVYKKSTRELTYASGGHPPALLIGGNAKGDSEAVLLRTPNNVIGGMPEVTYEKRECLVGEQDRLYIFSDGVYEVEKSDGSMWRLQEFTEFMNKVKAEDQSTLDHLHRYAGNLKQSDNFEDDFTIVEITFI
ncbi:Serine phosphatase RsbU, regulator of sigma subunit [Olavius sp. associated proteobacterium Delta 1]|nr:Serine phosphatase RsbU, regulator of sigma subunit [Olavius sp. associated proteobacterium Delta 1]